jgi:flagellar biosynthesis protein FlhF
MTVKTFRARSMQEALALVRRDLGSQASVLHTREVRPRGLARLLGAPRMFEVVASACVSVPSRLPPRRDPMRAVPRTQVGIALDGPIARAAGEPAARAVASLQLYAQLTELQAKVDGLFQNTGRDARPDLPDCLFGLFTDLIDADLGEDAARELVDRVRRQMPAGEPLDRTALKERAAGLIEDEISIAGPIQVAPGRRHLVALVGPTGVGKTTTIAKLAANFRLREKRRVGLITVDTYRIAAVEQLRTYADIIDLPMEIVSTPREMHQAVARMADLDLILMDTAGRSPRDDVQIQELKSMLAEAAPDEVHLVLSSVASAASLVRTAEQFAVVGTTALVLTKLDEAVSLGNLLALVRGSKLPLSYLTHGQNVPDDIAPADNRLLAGMILGLDPVRDR